MNGESGYRRNIGSKLSERGEGREGRKKRFYGEIKVISCWFKTTSARRFRVCDGER